MLTPLTFMSQVLNTSTVQTPRGFPTMSQ